MNFELRHPQAPAPLLSAGQGSDLYGKGADILLIPHIEIVPGQVDGGGAVVGLPVVRGAEGHSTFFGLPGQVPGGVLHNPGLTGTRSSAPSWLRSPQRGQRTAWR